MSYAWDKHTLSYATGPSSAYVLFAIKPRRFPVTNESGKQTGEVIAWWDYDHQRAFDLKSVQRDEFAVFEFTDTMGREMTLRPMDLRTYNDKVKPRIPDARTFKTDAALRKFFTEDIFRLER